MGHASKGMLVLRPVHAIGHRLLPFGTQRFACGHWTHRASTGFERAHPKRASYRSEDEAMLRIRCWRGGSVQATEVQACALTIVPLRPNMAAGGWWR